MRLAACTLAALAVAVLLGGAAQSARTDGGASWTLQPVSQNQKWLRVSVQGEPLYGFHVRGTDFKITAVKRVLVSGGPTTSCALRGTTPTLECDGELPGGTSVFVNVEFGGSGGAYEIALLFQPGDTNLLFIPSNQLDRPLPLGGTFGETSATSGRVTVHNPSTSVSFRQIEVAPVGFRITAISRVSMGTRDVTRDCGLTEGGGAACQVVLGPAGTAALTFTTTGFTPQASAVLLTQDPQSAFIVAATGNPCADIESTIAGLQAEVGALQGEIAKLKRGLAIHAGVFTAQLEDMRGKTRTLERLLVNVRAALRGAQSQLRACAPDAKRKAAAVTACDPEGKTASRLQGKVKGLSAALVVERRLAASARPLVVQLKKLGPRAGAGWRTALERLSTLTVLPQKTSGSLLEAQGVAIGAEYSLAACEATLQQG